VNRVKILILATIPSFVLCAQKPAPSNQIPAPDSCGHFFQEFAFLWWQPTDSATEFADVVTKQNVIGVAAATSGQPTLSRKFQSLEWSPGFSIAMGWKEDRWDVKCDWHWFYNKSTKHLQASPQVVTSINTGFAGTENGAGIYGTWLGEWIPSNVSTAFNVPSQLVYPGPFASAKSTSKLKYDTIDAETGYTYLTNINALRFLFGLRGAIIDRTARAEYSSYTNLGSLLTGVPPTNGFASGSYKGKLNFWGLGPRVGLYDELSWAGAGMKFFGQISAALLYGPIYGNETMTLNGLALSVPSLFGGTIYKTPRQWHTVTNLQLLLGLGWHHMLGGVDFGINASWESNMWFMPPLRTSIYPGSANLSLNGLKLALELSY
jgi:hypothetical protein